MTAVPRISATVILFREKPSRGLEVFLLRRSLGSAFMPGNYVCPGGNVEKDDHDPCLLPFLAGGQGSGAGKEGLPVRIAGMRELFEEAGVLLARRPAGGMVTMEDAPAGERFRGYRTMLHNKGITFAAMAEKEGFLLCPEELHYFAHWITPESRPLRFDTRFFLCLCPDGQEASADNTETTEGIWLSPAGALEANLSARIVLSAPTLKTLEDMLPYGSADELIASLAGRDVPDILPAYVELRDQSLVVFPWDKDFARFEKGDIPHPVRHGRLSQPGDNTTRVVMEKDRNTPYCKE